MLAIDTHAFKLDKLGKFVSFQTGNQASLNLRDSVEFVHDIVEAMVVRRKVSSEFLFARKNYVTSYMSLSLFFSSKYSPI